MKRFLFALWPLGFCVSGACQLMTGTSGLEVVGTGGPGHGGAGTSTSSSTSSTSTSSTSTSSTSTSSTSSGAGGAAPTCGAYCALMTANCTDDSGFKTKQYPSDATCAFVCDLAAPLGVLPCLYTAAQQSDCLNAGPASTTCGDKNPCTGFCLLEQQICGMCPPYQGLDCATACKSFSLDPPYAQSAPDEDTFACRMKYLMQAAVDPQVACDFCVQTGPSSGSCAGGTGMDAGSD